MKKYAVLAASVLAASAFAQATVTSGTGVTVTSGTGVVVTPAVPLVAPPPSHVMGAAMVQSGSTTVVSGPTTTITTRYWANVPADVERDDRFQRWQRLR
jgi:hypothetical protein